MDKKTVSIILFVISGILFFVAIERYMANASAVDAMNQMGGEFFKSLSGGEKMTPSTPAITIYSVLLAIVSGVAGLVLKNQK